MELSDSLKSDCFVFSLSGYSLQDYMVHVVVGTLLYQRWARLSQDRQGEEQLGTSGLNFEGYLSGFVRPGEQQHY